MIRVVFGAVNVDVHLVTGIKVELAQAGFVAPGSAVETFYYSSPCHVWPVGHCTAFQIPVFHDVQQRLHAVEHALLIGSANVDGFLLYAYGITFAAVGDLFGNGLDRFVALYSKIYGESGFRVFARTGSFER